MSMLVMLMIQRRGPLLNSCCVTGAFKDYDAVAEMTDGMVGAQLANILDVAALSVLRDRRSEV
jgi:hypothetical protein